MKTRLAAVLAVLALVLLPAAAVAAEPGSEDVTDVLMRTNGPVHVVAGDTAHTVVVISDNATIDGTVTEQLVVIGGDATVTGTVRGSVVVVNGTLTLAGTSVVDHDARIIHGTLVREAGATVNGTVHEQGWVVISAGFIALFWIAITVVVVVAGLLFAAAGGKQLTGAAGLITGKPGETVLMALIIGVALPVAAVLAFVSVVGIPLGIGILFFLTPAVWFLGYLTTGAALGGTMLRAKWMAGEEGKHPYLAVTLGVLTLQIVGFVPWIGGLAVFTAGAVGAGALVYRVWQQLHGTRAPKAVAAPA